MDVLVEVGVNVGVGDGVDVLVDVGVNVGVGGLRVDVGVAVDVTVLVGVNVDVGLAGGGGLGANRCHSRSAVQT